MFWKKILNLIKETRKKEKRKERKKEKGEKEIKTRTLTS
jgi:hypothetical protein